MGHSARPENVIFVVTALGDVLESMGADVDPGAGVTATRRALSETSNESKPRRAYAET